MWDECEKSGKRAKGEESQVIRYWKIVNRDSGARLLVFD